MPLASQTSLVRHLSIASAEAITPLPVYGMPQQLERALHRAVLAEAAVQRDEDALRSLRASGRTGRARAGSNGCASTPCLAQRRRARALPDISEISRSADRPPSSTATLPNSAAGLMLARCLFPMMRTSRLEHRRRSALAHGRLHVLDQRLDVGGASRAPPGLTMKLACFSETRAPPIA